MKKCLGSQIIAKMQVKTYNELTFHPWVSCYQKDKTCFGKNLEIRNTCTQMQECKLAEHVWQITWRLLKVKLNYDRMQQSCSMVFSQINKVKIPEGYLQPCLLTNYSQ